jgi:hypothetical protein
VTVFHLTVSGDVGRRTPESPCYSPCPAYATLSLHPPLPLNHSRFSRYAVLTPPQQGVSRDAASYKAPTPPPRQGSVQEAIYVSAHVPSPAPAPRSVRMTVHARGSVSLRKSIQRARIYKESVYAICRFLPGYFVDWHGGAALSDHPGR